MTPCTLDSTLQSEALTKHHEDEHQVGLRSGSKALPVDLPPVVLPVDLPPVDVDEQKGLSDAS